MAKRRKKKQQLSFKGMAVIALLVVIAVVLYIFVPPVKTFVNGYLYPEVGPSVNPSAFQGAGENELAVHFIDVGQGDSILIELPDGKKMVIDGGDRSYEDEVQDYITAMGITKIDYLIATHYDSDHIGGLDGVFGYTEVDVAYLPAIAEGKIDTGVYDSLMEAVRAEEGCEIRYNLTGIQISTEGTANEYRITWLSPEQSLYDEINSKNTLDSYDKNDVSPIMLLEYQGKKIGIKLLQSAEAAISLTTNTVELISLGNACKFYEKHGYTSPESTNKFCKNVKESGNGLVSPVFIPSVSLIRQMAKISNKPATLFDKTKLSTEHTPIFIYRNLDSKICGFAIAGDTPAVYTTPGWSPMQLNGAIRRYQEFINSR